MFKSVHTTIKFNGRNVVVNDLCPTYVDIYPANLKDLPTKKEQYVFSNVKMHVGNLIIGERYIEPYGKVHIKNKTTGDTCETEFKARGSWFNGVNDIG
jgi:hypothetical protein